ncbi:hypothetical protein DL93DRAFT_2075368 [Clavulina sp. PMI_390]|nr:hypothetical protein DL93DRAFT_2075368 [Clavulina sp. PMI_390]
MDKAHPCYIVLLKALRASGDIDEVHANSVSLAELVARWDKIRLRILNRDHGPTRAQTERVSDWISSGILDDIVSMAELMKPSPLTAPFPTIEAFRRFDPLTHSLLSILYGFTLLVPKCCGDSTFSAILDSQVSENFILRLLRVLSNLKHLNFPYDPAPPIEVIEVIEQQRSWCFDIVAIFLSRSELGDPPLLSYFSYPVHESALRFAVLGPRPLIPAIWHYGNGLTERPSVFESVTKSLLLIELALGGIRHISHSLGAIERTRRSLSDITGLPADIIFGGMLELADALSGVSKAGLYRMAAEMIVAEASIRSSKLTVAALRQHNYIHRSILLLRPLLFGQQLDETLDETGVERTSAQIVQTWLVCIQNLVEDDPLVGEAIEGGIVFLLEKIALSSWDELKSEILGILSSLLNFLNLAKNKALLTKFAWQRFVVHRRMVQNHETPSDIRRSWELKITSYGFKINFWDGVSQYCSNPACDSTEAALLRCGACTKRYYCSKECQTLNWKMHKRQCKKMTAKTDG